MNALLQDIRFGARSLLKNPMFTAVACLSLALGIGAVSTVYSMVSAVLLHPLPYDDASRIMLIEDVHKSDGTEHSVSYPELVDWQERNKSFEHISAYSGSS